MDRNDTYRPTPVPPLPDDPTRARAQILEILGLSDPAEDFAIRGAFDALMRATAPSVVKNSIEVSARAIGLSTREARMCAEKSIDPHAYLAMKSRRTG